MFGNPKSTIQVIETKDEKKAKQRLNAILGQIEVAESLKKEQESKQEVFLGATGDVEVVKNELSDLNNTKLSVENEIKLSKEQWEKDKTAHNLEVKQAEIKLSKMKDEKSTLEKSISSLKTQNNELSNANVGLKESNTALTTTETSLVNSIKTKSDELTSITSDVKGMEDKKTSLETLISQYNETILDLENRKNELVDSTTNLTEKNNELANKIVKATEKLDSIKNEQKQVVLDAEKSISDSKTKAENELKEKENALAVREGDCSRQESWIEESKKDLAYKVSEAEKFFKRKFNINI